MLSIAQRAKVFCTEDTELRASRRSLEIDVVNRDEFIERFTASRQGRAEPARPTSNAYGRVARGQDS